MDNGTVLETVYAYVFDGAVIEVVLMAAPKTEVGVESSVSGRVLLRVETQVPFTDDVVAVAEISEILRQQSLTERKSSRLGAFQDLIRHDGRLVRLR